jgi:4-hydroxybenzoate polyprenyltransferase
MKIFKFLAKQKFHFIKFQKFKMCTNKEDMNTRYNPEHLDKQTKKLNIIDRLPEKIQVYLKLGRYDRPIGYMLLFWPCTWGLTLGTPEFSYLYYKCLALFFSGSVLMRSSGCIINDMWDKDIDSKVIRSQDRPLASNKITYKQALLFLSAHLGLSLCILLQLPIYSIVAGLGIMPIVCIYPYMKRVTNFPQFFLGLAFNSGVIVGLASITGILPIDIAIPLYSAGILWTLVYDTIYAHMDKNDDIKINIKSTAIFFGDNTKVYLCVFIILMMALFYIAINKKKNSSISNILLLSGLIFQLNSIYKVNLSSPISCLRYFKLNNYFGLIIFLACVFSNNNK